MYTILNAKTLLLVVAYSLLFFLGLLVHVVVNFLDDVFRFLTIAVQPQLGQRAEHFAARAALYLLAGVYPHVSDQIVLIRERFPAVRTHKRPLASVQHNVTTTMSVIPKRLRAMRALVRSFTYIHFDNTMNIHNFKAIYIYTGMNETMIP